MAKISSSIKNEKYKMEIHSPSGNVVVADEQYSGYNNFAF